MSKVFFTPLEKVHPFRDLSLTEQTNKIGGKDINPVGKKFLNGIREDSLTGFTVRNVLILAFFPILFYLSVTSSAAKGNPIVITSQTLTADNKNNIAVFEGSVVATSGDVVIYSDNMKVSYNDSPGEITKIHAYGNVRVKKKERAIFSKEAVYLEQEGKIIFTGEPKAFDGENVITGSKIIYFFKDDRTVVENSNIVINNNEE